MWMWWVLYNAHFKFMLCFIPITVCLIYCVRWWAGICMVTNVSRFESVPLGCHAIVMIMHPTIFLWGSNTLFSERAVENGKLLLKMTCTWHIPNVNHRVSCVTVLQDTTNSCSLYETAFVQIASNINSCNFIITAWDTLCGDREAYIIS